VSGRAPISEETVLHFKSTLLGTNLTCTYRAGQAAFLSDSISALAILREAISKEANSAKMRVNISYQLNQGSVGHMLGLLWPQLSAQRQLAKKVRVMEALQEIEMQEGEVEHLSAERKEDLKNAEKLRKEFAAQPRRLEYLIGAPLRSS
jgi:Bardet-Biedl syndrome 7 protein